MDINKISNILRKAKSDYDSKISWAEYIKNRDEANANLAKAKKNYEMVENTIKVREQQLKDLE